MAVASGGLKPGLGTDDSIPGDKAGSVFLSKQIGCIWENGSG